MKPFISNLPIAFTEEQIRNLLEEHCDILRLEVLTSGQTGKSKGFAFLKVADDGQGKLLIAALNGFSIYCRPLSVSQVV